MSQWFTNEVYAHDGQLRSYLRRSFPSVPDVEDVVQESYLRIWKAKLVRPIRSTKSFLFQIAHHLAIDRLRKKGAVQVETLVDFAELAVIEHRPDAAEMLCYQERVDLLSDALLSLSTRSREIIFMRKFQGVSQKDVAAMLGISERTVEVQLARGMKLCATYLRKKGVHGFTSDHE